MVFAAEAEGNIGTEQVKALRIIEPEDVAEAVVRGLASEKFLILPHEEVRDYVAAKAADHDAWIGAMRRFQNKLLAGGASPTPGT